MDSFAEQNPGVRVWFIEGLDLVLADPKKCPLWAGLDRLQRVAQRRNLYLLASVGAPKAKGDDREKYHGRDGLFGSAAWARKARSIVLLSFAPSKGLKFYPRRMVPAARCEGWPDVVTAEQAPSWAYSF